MATALPRSGAYFVLGPGGFEGFGALLAGHLLVGQRQVAGQWQAGVSGQVGANEVPRD